MHQTLLYRSLIAPLHRRDYPSAPRSVLNYFILAVKILHRSILKFYHTDTRRSCVSITLFADTVKYRLHAGS